MNAKKILSAMALVGLVGSRLTAASLGTGFMYQGQLDDGGNPANGRYDLRFVLYNDAVAGSQKAAATNANILVSQGVFQTLIDFGAAPTTPELVWLELGVRTNGSAADFSALSPRQPITPVPFAFYATNAGLAAIALTANGVAANVITAANLADATITAAKIASGQVVKSLNGLTDAVTLNAGTNVSVAVDGNGLRISATPGTVVTNAGWGLSGNAGTTSNNFLGTTDGQAFELRSGNRRALRLEASSGGPGVNVIGGLAANAVADGVAGATIGGGGGAHLQGGFPPRWISDPNVVANSYGTIAGGVNNWLGGWAATLAGGADNTILTGADYAFLGGGQTNVVGAGAHHASIGGGLDNQIEPGAFLGTIGGGTHNRVHGPGGTVPGGNGNEARGYNTFAAGTQAHAQHDGAFVWADNTYIDFTSTAPNQFLIRASGGVGINTPSPIGMLQVEGDSWLDHPHLLLHETQDSDFARFRLKAGAHAFWDIAAGGGNNDLNFYRDGSGDLMTLSSDASTDTFLTLRTANNLFPRLQQRFQGGSGNSFTIDVFPDDWLGVKWNDNVVVMFDKNGRTTACGDLNASGNCSIISNLYCATLTIRGGADLAEPFDMSQAEIPKGAVVIIDKAHPGQLKLSERAYDTRVAGVVSGAGGIQPGISLHQEGLNDAGQNVALSGRVRVQADAAYGPIKPGDLLTTSDTPGHAMKVADPAQAQGAILGKAMSGLKEGKGLVLVLVTLQ